ncbi:MAG: cysteine peptidase family C39 domain-containing protein [Kiritimatiellae bacterium]|nr:cysteine peptidase family C39 domain-containing protein [Kiritimatiellia bacterium]
MVRSVLAAGLGVASLLLFAAAELLPEHVQRALVQKVNAGSATALPPRQVRHAPSSGHVEKKTKRGICASQKHTRQSSARSVPEKARKKDIASTVKRMKDELDSAKFIRPKRKTPIDRYTYLVYIDPDSQDEVTYEETGAKVYPGDVFISGIPMIDQGQRPYCAVASAARVLATYGIDMSMEEMAYLANTTMEGTSDTKLKTALQEVIGPYGLTTHTIAPLSPNISWKNLNNYLDSYNKTADLLGYQGLDVDYCQKVPRLWKRLAEDLDFSVLQLTLLSNDIVCESFRHNVIEQVEARNPLLWGIFVGMAPEEYPRRGLAWVDPRHGTHMRLIIGYNEIRDEILYSDSWGDGHELKRMSSADALAITTGLQYLSE